MVDTYYMDSEKKIIDDLQVRSLSYTLLRKYDSGSIPDSIVLETALRFAYLLGMEEWQGYEAHRAYVELRRPK